MGKRKGNSCGRSKSVGPGTSTSVLNSDEETNVREDDPNDLGRSFIYDEIDEFHVNREKVLLEDGKRSGRRSYESENEEEVYALSGDDSLDDDDDNNEENIAYFQALANKDRDDLASDLEDHDDGSDLPNVKAWGTDRSTFYNTDFVDNDRGFFKEWELRLAEAEEKEAMDMQKRMLEQLDDDDFELDLFRKAKVQLDDEYGRKIGRDISGLSKQEKLEVIRQESPELLSLLEDFRAKLLEIKDVVQPLIDLVNEGKIPSGLGADYLNVKHQLLLNYCTNVCFYVTLKVERADTNNHPIIKRLVGYRKLMKELEAVDVLMADQMSKILKFLDTGKDVSKLLENTVTVNAGYKQLESHLKSVNAHAVIGDDNEIASSLATSISMKRAVADPLLTADEKEALQLYSLMKTGRYRSAFGVHDGDDDFNDTLMEEENLEEGDGNTTSVRAEETVGVGKRKITCQIEKNKGLIPYRKKDRRNPRVKNRNKYRKAKIRRKGQVQEVRRELKKYGGEISGIRVGTSRSIKLK